MTVVSGARNALVDLACAWTKLKLADRNMLAKPEADFRKAVEGLEDLGDYSGPIPSRVLTAARSLARQWVLSDRETRAGVLSSAVDVTIRTAMAYVGGEETAPIGRVIPLTGHQRAAGDAA